LKGSDWQREENTIRGKGDWIHLLVGISGKEKKLEELFQIWLGKRYNRGGGRGVGGVFREECFEDRQEEL